MDTPMNQAPAKEKIQVYHNDFYHGFLRLTKKLFML